MKWTQEEIDTALGYAISCDEETMEDTYNYVHNMMYNEGNHPKFPIRTLSALTRKLRACIKKRKSMN